MKTMRVIRTSIFPASKHEVFTRLLELKTLQTVAAPYATFTPVDENAKPVWEPGKTSAYKFRLFGLIPFGTHTIHVIRFDEENGIYTNEDNGHVPVWNHEITLRATGPRECEYTDHVEIGAGWKTPFIWLWAQAFYAHRQRKWIRILKKNK